VSDQPVAASKPLGRDHATPSRPANNAPMILEGRRARRATASAGLPELGERRAIAAARIPARLLHGRMRALLQREPFAALGVTRSSFAALGGTPYTGFAAPGDRTSVARGHAPRPVKAIKRPLVAGGRRYAW
jgi:hypothetical protein